jgi:FMN phosphatase YigB (HAD superfamily)
MNLTKKQKNLIKKYSINPNSNTLKKELIEKISELEFNESISDLSYKETVTLEDVEQNIIRCPDSKTAKKMIELIEKTKKNEDSIGGVITGIIRNCPVGLGEPEFDKLPAELAKAMMSINATKGFEIGSGFKGSELNGSQHNDIFIQSKNPIKVILVDVDSLLSLSNKKSFSSYQLKEVLEKKFKITNYEEDLEIFWEKNYIDLISGKKDLISEIKPFLDKIGWEKSTEDFVLLCNQINNKINWQLFEILVQIKNDNNIKLYAFSQQEKHQAKYLKEQFIGLFEAWFISSELKLLKIEKALFLHILSKLNLEPNQILVLDCNLEVIKLAEKLSFQTLHYDSFKDSITKITNKITNKKIYTKTNHSGGVLGGISNGQTIYFRVAIKPVATIAQSQQTLNKNGQKISFEGKGRHDPCVLPRAVPIVESMAALVIMDLYLRNNHKS